MASRNVVSLGVFFLCGMVVLADGPGRVGPDRVAAIVAAMKEPAGAGIDYDQVVNEQGEMILAAASRSRLGMPPVGMKGIPRVGGNPEGVKSKATKIGAPGKSCAVTLYRKVRKVLFSR